MGTHIEIISRGLVLQQGCVLLCRSVKAGYRYLPGGHVELGERAAEALEREFLEECGRKVSVGPLVYLSEERFHDGHRDRHELNLVFSCELLAGSAGTPGRSTKQAGPADQVFHVEHSGERVGAVAGAMGGQAAIPPPVASLEPKIAFDWIRLGAIAGAELRPPSIVRWLLALGPSPRPQPLPFESI